MSTALPLASGPRPNSARDRAKLSFTLTIFLTTSMLVACAGLGSNSTPAAQNQSQHLAIDLAVGAGTLPSGSQQQFTATVTNSSNSGVIWTASMGRVSKDGVYVAPQVASDTQVVITARSVADRDSLATATLMITPSVAASRRPIASSIIASNVAPGTATSDSGLAGDARISTSQGSFLSASSPRVTTRQSISSDRTAAVVSAAVVSAAVSGSMSSGVSHPPSAASASTATPRSAASQPVSSSATSQVATYDGPAELPLVYMQSSQASTPAPGATILVSQGGDLQRALNQAKCGETIELQAGATYTGLFTFPAKSCDDDHWIVVRTSAPDSALPPEGTRITPCYAGVSSLPGRPALHCASTANVMAKLIFGARTGSGPIQFASGANHYRLLGLEVTRHPGRFPVYSLASIPDSGTANSIVYDRVWMHGNPQDETQRGVQLGASTYVAVVDSFFTDFHCIARTGACSDAQAVSGGTSNSTMGPYQIVDNFLEASAQSIIFGGGSATQTPTDIEIRRNHMFKPLTWMRGQPGFVGGTDGRPFIVKNLFELKNAQRVLFEGNILENTWGGFSQVGFGILVTPKNQAIGNKNVCPICQVTDVTIRYNTISHVAAGLQIGDGLSDNGGAPLAGQRYSIHGIVVDDIEGQRLRGPGNFAQISMGVGSPVLQNLAINHITAFPPDVMLNVGDQTTTNPQMNDFAFTNSIVNAGDTPVRSTGGGPANCAFYNSPLTTLNACFASYSFQANAIIASPEKFSGTWPSGNMFPQTPTAVEFVNYNNGKGGDYHLQSSSRYKNAGTDGKDLGADIDAVESAIANVR